MSVVPGALYDRVELPFQHARRDALRAGEPLPVKPAQFRETPSSPVHSFFAELRGLRRELAVELVLLSAGEVLGHGGELWIGAHPLRREPLEEIADIRFGSRQKPNCQKQERECAPNHRMIILSIRQVRSSRNSSSRHLASNIPPDKSATRHLALRTSLVFASGSGTPFRGTC